MKIVLAAFAVAIATPAAAQPAAAPAGHSGHQQHNPAGHAQHGQAGHGQHGGQHGQHQNGQRHDCPCCRPAADGQRPACCETMHRQERQGSH